MALQYPTEVYVTHFLATLTSVDGDISGNLATPVTGPAVDGDLDTNVSVVGEFPGTGFIMLKMVFDRGWADLAQANGDFIRFYSGVTDVGSFVANGNKMNIYAYTSSNGVTATNAIVDLVPVLAGWNTFSLTTAFIGELPNNGDDSFAIRITPSGSTPNEPNNSYIWFTETESDITPVVGGTAHTIAATVAATVTHIPPAILNKIHAISSNITIPAQIDSKTADLGTERLLAGSEAATADSTAAAMLVLRGLAGDVDATVVRTGGTLTVTEGDPPTEHAIAAEEAATVEVTAAALGTERLVAGSVAATVLATPVAALGTERLLAGSVAATVTVSAAALSNGEVTIDDEPTADLQPGDGLLLFSDSFNWWKF